MPHLHWIGKEKVIHHHNDVIYRPLIAKETFGDVEIAKGNMIIHGDNLEALKSLLPQYEGRVDCIYIDPPYNTGNESWVYNDNVNHPKIKKWLGEVVGKDGEDLSRHDKWLCMMYPRLKLLHKLLAETGVIFISLDDNEIVHLRMIMNEIFGENSFICQIIVQSNKRGQTYKEIAKTHEYLLCFGKSEAEIGELSTEGTNLPENDEYGKFSARELRNRNPKFGRHNRPNLFYPIYVDISASDTNGHYPISTELKEGFIEVLPYNSEGVESCWRWGKPKTALSTIDGSTKELFAKQTREGAWRIFEKYRKESVKVKSIWMDTKHISEQGTNELANLGLADKFQFPKPLGLVEDCIAIATDEDSIILDSFAGSGTTAHAVLRLNAEEKSHREFILIEMMDYAKDLTAERVRRAITGYGVGDKTVKGLGGGFTFYDLGLALFDDKGNLSEPVNLSKLREYVWYVETKAPFTEQTQSDFLGCFRGIGYYLLMDDSGPISLTYRTLAKISQKQDSYVIYGESCTLSEEFLLKNHIIFKKIPNQLARI